MNKTVTLRKNEDLRIASGHLWAFSNEIEKIAGDPQAGDIVELRNHAGDLIEIKPATGGDTLLVPFTDATVPDIDIASRRLTLVLPEGLLDEPNT